MPETAHRHDHQIVRDLTRNQSIVLGALSTAGSPLSAYDLLDRLRPEGLKAPLQIYRALDVLVERGLAHRLESLNSFVACADDSGHRHGPMAFVICNICGKVDEFVDTRIGARIANWTKENGYKAEQTTIEIRGKCATCLQAA